MGALSAALFVSACGGDDGGQFANEPTGDFPVEIIDAEFKPLQTIAETYDLTIAVRNSGEETIPTINVVIDLPGLDSTLPFAYADQQEGLAMNQRPVWVLEEGWPKLADTTGRGGTTTASRMTFEFGELDAGDTANMVWRLTAVRPGNYLLRYQIGAGLGTDIRAVDANGNQPEGQLRARIDGVARLTEINEKGQVVTVSPSEQARVDSQIESADSEYLP